MLFEVLGISLAVWVAYWNAMKNFYVSDDIEAIQQYDGKFTGWDYGHFVKFLFYRLFEKSPARHHLFSVIMHNANVVLTYFFLLCFFPPQVCFFTCLLFAIHPITNQTVAWISARGYLIGTFWMLLGLNIASTMPVFGVDLGRQLIFSLFTVLYAFLYFMAIHGQFATFMTFVIQVFLGNWFLGIIGAGISFVMGFGIIKEVIGIRKKVFAEQNMEASTKVHHKKFIVAMKSLAYYTQLCFFPKRLGLYHKYGYHYDEKIEKEDIIFWLGFILLLVFISMFIWGNFLIRFGVLWYLSYLFIFLNWITIHQFVTERYCYIPVVGLCLILSGVLVDFPVVFALICGIYLMRTWANMPTYKDEISFYQSNIWNFPDSEVAFANLGVIYMRCGLIGSAMDMWLISAKINPNYDVAYYNLHSTVKQKGDFKTARNFLKKAVDSPHCHFKKLWSDELTQLEHEINYLDRVIFIRNKLEELKKDPTKGDEAAKLVQRIDGIQRMHIEIEEGRKQCLTLIYQEETNLKLKQIALEKAKEQSSKPLNVAEIVKIRDKQFTIVNQEAEKLGVIYANTSSGTSPQGL